MDFADPTEFEDADGIFVSVRYIEKVSHTPTSDHQEVLTTRQILLKLEAINI